MTTFGSIDQGGYNRLKPLVKTGGGFDRPTLSEIRLFADDCVCYREIKDIEDTLKLQKDIDRLGIWARKWGMRFQPVKCNMMQLTKKHNKIQASYTLEGTVLENVDSIKYLGVTITSDLKLNSHIRNVCSKANRTLGFLRQNLFSCPQDVKEAAYKSMVRPILEYGSTVWDPHCNGLNDELENVQKRAARFVTRNYSYETGSMTGILEELKWETLQKRRKDNRLILLYKGLKGGARIPTDDLIPKNRRCRNQHSLVFQIPTASKDAYKKSFFPQTIRPINRAPLGHTRFYCQGALLPWPDKTCNLFPIQFFIISPTQSF